MSDDPLFWPTIILGMEFGLAIAAVIFVVTEWVNRRIRGHLSKAEQKR